MQKVTLKIDGMMCGMCEAHICDAIRNAFPVKKVIASHKKGQAEIFTETDIAEDALNAVIAKMGYELKSIAAEPYEKKGLFHRG